VAHLLMKFGVFKWMRSSLDTPSGQTQIAFRVKGMEDEVIIRGCDLTDEQCLEIKQQMDLFVEQYRGRPAEIDNPADQLPTEDAAEN